MTAALPRTLWFAGMRLRWFGCVKGVTEWGRDAKRGVVKRIRIVHGGWHNYEASVTIGRDTVTRVGRTFQEAMHRAFYVHRQKADQHAAAVRKATWG